MAKLNSTTMKIAGNVFVNNKGFCKRICKCTLCGEDKDKCEHTPVFVAEKAGEKVMTCGNCAVKYYKLRYKIYEIIY